VSYPYVQAVHHGGTQSAVNRIVIHATVSPCVRGGAKNIANYFHTTTRDASAHYVVDPGVVYQCLKETTIGYHAPPNTGSIGIELCDPQTGPASRWQDANHQAMLRLAATLTRDVAARWKVPLVKLSAADLKADRRGICGHVDVSNAWHLTDHGDPMEAGPFPWDQFMQLVTQEDDMPTVKEIWHTDGILKAPPSRATADNPEWRPDSYLLELYERTVVLEKRLSEQDMKLDKIMALLTQKAGG
jgi:N-acetyl-anhydromuramyl-L-alanine amidase AmpD